MALALPQLAGCGMQAAPALKRPLLRPKPPGSSRCRGRAAWRSKGPVAAAQRSSGGGSSCLPAAPARGGRAAAADAGSGSLQDAGAGGRATAAQATASLINCAVGAGILSMPYAFSLTGWALGLGLTAAVAALEAGTLLVLCQRAEAAGGAATSYSALVSRELGPGAGTALALLLYTYLLLSCTAYIMIAADCLGPLLGGLAGAPDAWWAGRQAVVAAVGLGACLPLSMPRTLGAVAGVSTLKLYAIAFVVGAVVWRSAQALAAPGYPWHAVHASLLAGGGGTGGAGAGWGGLAVALPILAFGFQCHTAAVDLYSELEDKPSFFNSSTSSGDGSSSSSGGSGSWQHSGGGGGSSNGGASPKLAGMAGVGAASMAAMAAFYGLMGVAGYLAFPQGLDSNVMNGFAADDPLMQVSRALVGLIVVAAFPVNHVPARSTALDLLGRHGDGAYAAETLAFCSVATAIALSVSDLGTMFQLVGGTAAAVLIFGIPGALLLKAASEPADAEPAGGDGGGAWRRGGLAAAGAALGALCIASWGATLYSLAGQQ